MLCYLVPPGKTEKEIVEKLRHFQLDIMLGRAAVAIDFDHTLTCQKNSADHWETLESFLPFDLQLKCQRLNQQNTLLLANHQLTQEQEWQWIIIPVQYFSGNITIEHINQAANLLVLRQPLIKLIREVSGTKTAIISYGIYDVIKETIIANELPREIIIYAFKLSYNDDGVVSGYHRDSVVLGSEKNLALEKFRALPVIKYCSLVVFGNSWLDYSMMGLDTLNIIISEELVASKLDSAKFPNVDCLIHPDNLERFITENLL